MTKTYDFSNGIPQEMTYCYVPAGLRYDTFLTANGGIESTPRDDDPSGGFMALLCETRFATGDTLSCVCSFTGSGAPMLVFGYGVTDKNGVKVFTRRLEIVAHKMGCNVWDVLPTNPDGTNPPSKKAAYIEFPVEDNTRVSLRAEIRARDIRVTMNGHVFGFPRDLLPETFVGGIMACEGPCRFTSMTVESEQ